MIVELLRDWGWNKCGEQVEVWDPTGQQWIREGIARLPHESRSEETENAEAVHAGVESAVVSAKRRHPHRR